MAWCRTDDKLFTWTDADPFFTRPQWVSNTGRSNVFNGYPSHVVIVTHYAPTNECQNPQSVKRSYLKLKSEYYVAVLFTQITQPCKDVLVRHLNTIKTATADDTVNHSRGFTNFSKLRSDQNGRHFANDIFKYISCKDDIYIQIQISLKFVLLVPIDHWH